VFVANAVRPASWPVRSAAFEEVPIDGWGPFIRDNLEQTVRTVQLVLPGMRGRQWGRITFVSTHLVREGRSGRGFYAASKAALHGLSRSLSWEVGHDGVLVNVVCPGLTVTERVAGMPETLRRQEAERTPSGRLCTPDEVARTVVFVSSGANGNITGEVLAVAGGR
jgi:3-oxoacyl-[acyl-carrier protein] reductase